MTTRTVQASIVVLLAAVLAAGCVNPLGATAPRYYLHDVLQGDPFTELVVEIDHAPGRAPSEGAKAHLLKVLKEVTHKTDVRFVVEQSLPNDSGKRWTGDELIALERETRSTEHKAPVAVLRILYPAGTFENGAAAGVAFGGKRLAPAVVFMDSLRDLSTVIPGTTVPAERAVLVHEVGHALGLVNTGITPVNDHEDPQHPGHSKNPKSVMYWQVNKMNGLREMLLRDGSIPDTFDSDDREDLRSAGGR